MATSGSYGLSLEFAELIDDAFEDLGIDPASLSLRHIQSAIRKTKRLFARWGNEARMPWRISRGITLNLVDGQTTSYSLQTGTIDVLDAALRREGVDVPMLRMSNADWLAIPDKDTEGKPDRFLIDRQRTPVMYIWPIAENSTDDVIYDALLQIQQPGAMANTPDLPDEWHDAYLAGLSWMLSKTYAPTRTAGLKVDAKEALDIALQGSRDRTATVIRPVRGLGRRARW